MPLNEWDDEEVTPSNERAQPPDSLAEFDEQMDRTADDAPPPATSEVQPPGDATPAPELDQVLLAEAQALGLAEQVKQLGDPQTARVHLNMVRAALGQMALQRAQSGLPEQPPGAPPVPESSQPPQPVPVDSATAFALQPMQLDEYDPALQAMGKNLQGLHQHVSQRMATLESRLQEVTSALQQTVVANHRARFDQMVAQAGPEYAELLGSGPTEQLDPGSEHYQRRLAIAKQMDLLHAGYAAMNQRPPDVAALYQAAAALVLRDQLAVKARNEVETRMRDQQGRFAPAPRRRSAVSHNGATGEEAARQFVRERYRQLTRS